ncbi:hypothetical protein [Bacillus sp. AFS055030]|uniref:hypothetical protein n=1 Tax=Bacillus sp. AFS055030 TaxID=2033507 RepID=UPI000BFBE5D7|nr:hypothetical protein [Bacillus sp. AFS055030]PGL72070.1 hypothetical protein CN925_05875 [Bacillus sp. AFS055030]
MRLWSKYLAVIISFAIVISFSFENWAKADEIEEDPIVSDYISDEEFLTDTNIDEQLNESIPMLDVIENMPDDVIANGPQAIFNYMRYNTPGIPAGSYQYIDSGDEVYFQISKPRSSFALPGQNNDVMPPYYPNFNTGECIVAIGIALLGGAIPISKILKIKSALKTVGGATKLVSKLSSEYKRFKALGYTRKTAFKKGWESAISNHGAEVKQALWTLFNIGDIYYNCVGRPAPESSTEQVSSVQNKNYFINSEYKSNLHKAS